MKADISTLLKPDILTLQRQHDIYAGDREILLATAIQPRRF